MVLAVIGTMKAGKSTTINAIVGMEVLPNRETAMTTLPTLIRHIHGQKQPVLKIKKNQPLRELSQAVAKKLQSLNDAEKKQIDLQGVEDGKTLITQLIQQQGYPFASEYTGQDAIFEFLKHLNDIMRLAKDEIIGIEPPYAEYENADDLPVIEVEFCHLKNNQNVAQGSLAILDTPGPNEFGQSAALRKVFKTQLEKASAVLLVTDFTQMKTEADQNVRDQIIQIESTLPKGSLYVVVNKFDQRNKNSMSKDEVKDYVAKGLMNGKVDTTQVFPVSSYLAYLASRAKSYLEQHDRLPTPEQEPWLADFADKAFGTGWEDDEEEEDIWAVAHVKEHIGKLEKKSLFEEPLEKVIKEAHADAANRSLNSAMTKLAEYNREFLNSLNVSSEMMTKSIAEIEKRRETLQKDIDRRCLKVSNDVKATAKLATGKLSSELDTVMKKQSQEINKALDTFFNEGRAMEKASFDKKKQDELKKRSGSGVFGVLSFFLETSSTGMNNQQIFNPHSSRISCSSAYEAETLINKINESIENTFKNADKALDIVTKELITETSETISKQIDDAVKEVLASAKAALTGDGNKIVIEGVGA
jgi:GTPase Era involved in 16S rRNA processing